MIALLLAAQLTAAAAPPPGIGAPIFSFRRQSEAASVCKGNGMMQTSGPADPALLYRDDGTPLSHRLADLPKPNKEKAVLRSIGPCAAPLVVQFNVGP